MDKPEELNQNAFDNGGDEELREDRGDFFDTDASNDPPDETKEEGGKVEDKKSEEPEKQTEPAKKSDPGGDGDDGSDSVPVNRFHQVNERKKALEQENELLRQMLLEQSKSGQAKQGGDQQQEQQQEQPQQSAKDSQEDAKQLRELRRQLKEALYADDEAKYDEIQDQIDAINERRNRAAIRAELEAREADRQAETIRNEFASTAQRMVEKFPVLNAETGDPEAIKKVVALRDYYINAEKLSPAAALEKASTEIGELYTGRGAASGDGKAANDQRRAAAIERGVKEANNQPPPTAQTGVGSRAQSARLNPDKMSEREFGSLPEEERARLRGDTV